MWVGKGVSDMEEDNENVGVCKSCGMEDAVLNSDGRCERCAGPMNEDVEM
jgi:predicted amidophosphoribosyltransferase